MIMLVIILALTLRFGAAQTPPASLGSNVFLINKNTAASDWSAIQSTFTNGYTLYGITGHLVQTGYYNNWIDSINAMESALPRCVPDEVQTTSRTAPLGTAYTWSTPIPITEQCWPGAGKCNTDGRSSIGTYWNLPLTAGIHERILYDTCLETVCPPGFQVYRMFDKRDSSFWMAFSCRYLVDNGCVDECVWASDVRASYNQIPDFRCDALEKKWSFDAGSHIIFLRGVRRFFLQPKTIYEDWYGYSLWSDQYCCRTQVFTTEGAATFNDDIHIDTFLESEEGQALTRCDNCIVSDTEFNFRLQPGFHYSTGYYQYEYTQFGDSNPNWESLHRAWGIAKSTSKNENTHCLYCDAWDQFNNGGGCCNGGTCIPCGYTTLQSPGGETIVRHLCYGVDSGRVDTNGFNCSCPDPYTGEKCCVDKCDLSYPATQVTGNTTLVSVNPSGSYTVSGDATVECAYGYAPVSPEVMTSDTIDCICRGQEGVDFSAGFPVIIPGEITTTQIDIKECKWEGTFDLECKPICTLSSLVEYFEGATCLSGGSFSADLLETGGAALYQAYVDVGYIVIATCDQDGGTATITCDDSLTWVGELPECSAHPTCQLVGTDPNADTGLSETDNDATIEVGQTQAVSCDEGYSYDGCGGSETTTYNCSASAGRTEFTEATGSWLPEPLPLCLENCCDATEVSAAGGGVMVTSSKTQLSASGTVDPGLSVTLVCDTGYYLSGTDCIVSCSQGTWNNLDSLNACSCQEMPCQSLPEIANQLTWTYNSTAVSDFYLAGTTAESCLQTLTCVEGQWRNASGDPAELQAGCNKCPALSPCSGTTHYTGTPGAVDGSDVLPNTFVRMECNPGYYPDPASSISSPYSMVCTNGAWSEDMNDFLALCIPDGCCDCLPNPSNPDVVTYAAGSGNVIETATASETGCTLEDNSLECPLCTTNEPYGSYWDGEFVCDNNA